MSKYNLIDDYLFNASPDKVFNAILDEYEGITNWWYPYATSTIRDGKTGHHIGSIVDITIHGKRPMKVTAKIEEIKPNERIKVNFIEGLFLGSGVWEFINLNGKTKCIFNWNANPGTFLLRILSPFIPLKKNHSALMQGGFNNLEKFLLKLDK